MLRLASVSALSRPLDGLWGCVLLTVVELLQALPEGLEVEEAVVLRVEFVPQGAGPLLPLGWGLDIHGVPYVGGRVTSVSWL